jgi:hypothetical protein
MCIERDRRHVAGVNIGQLVLVHAGFEPDARQIGDFVEICSAVT